MRGRERDRERKRERERERERAAFSVKYHINVVHLLLPLCTHKHTFTHINTYKLTHTDP